jgi:putative copper resistance protein D
LDVLLIVARWALFTALALTFGSSLFRFYAGQQPFAAEAAWRKAAAVGAILAAIAGAGWFAAFVIQLGGANIASFVETADLVLLKTDFGPAWLFTLAFLTALVVIACFIPRPTFVLALSAAILAT